ncbi:MAG: DUF935 domain-containing protein [Treponemataceae bacterium]|nr:DUF935 domain-containing protein [Treponemataceae bacterium]
MRTPTKRELTTQIVTDSVLRFMSYMPNPDDVASGTWDSYETYRKMRTDPRIKSLLGKIKNAALNFPLLIEQGKSAARVYSFVRDIPLFKNMTRKNKRILSALDYGFSVSELIWREADGRWIPDNYITRRPERFHFSADWKAYLRQDGRSIELDQDYKWLIYRHDPDDENPYGTSVLRCVYWAWMFKQAGYDFWLQATEKFSVKSIVALFEMDGSDDKISERASSIAQMLMGIQSGSAAAVGNISSINDVGMSGDLAHFRELVEACDVQISYGLTGQAIATSTTNGGSLALGEVQADLLYEECKAVALELQGVLQKIIDWTVALNYGAGVSAPQIVFDVERRASFEQVMQAVDRRIPLSRSALYSFYALPEPADEDDAFVNDGGAGGLQLSDDGKKSVKKNCRFC